MRFSKAVVKFRVPILILTVLLMIPSAIGMAKTRVNYDMLTYLPSDMETVIGQDELLEDFNKGAFTFLIFEVVAIADSTGAVTSVSTSSGLAPTAVVMISAY